MSIEQLARPHPRRVALIVLTGIIGSAVLSALYAQGGIAWPLGFVALVPWLLALDSLRSMRGPLACGVLMTFAFVAAVFPWFGAAIGAFTGIGSVAGTAVLVALAPLLQPQFVAYALVRHVARRRHGRALSACAAASAWVGCEWLLPKLLGDTLGHGLGVSAWMPQAADLFGAAGLTFLLLLANEAVAAAFSNRREGMRAWLRPIACACTIVATLAGYGAWRVSTLRAPPVDNADAVRIAMVQANITDYERRRREQGAYAVVRHVLDTHYALSWSAIRDHGADALLWSETVYPTTFGHPRSEDGAALDREIQGFVDTVGVPLVFGTYDRDDAGEYNAAAFLSPGRGTLGVYRKTHPFPLTEYVPRWLDGAPLRRALPWTGGWIPGDGARVLALRTLDGREVQVLPLICLDDVRPQLAIDGARLGAQAIVGMSNDAWFTAHPQGARLHLAVAAFRSIETRLPQVRVTTNGLSAIVDDTGAIQAQTRMGDQAVLTAFVSARDPVPTLMVRWGDWAGRAGLLFVLALLVVAPAWRAWRVRHAGHATIDVSPDAFEVSLLSPAMRGLVAALRLCAGAGLAWLALDMALRTGVQVRSLAQLRVFALAVVAPAVAAWALLRMARARAHIEASALVVERGSTRIEIPLASIVALRPWRIPLPRAGADLWLASGRRWTHGIALGLPHALRRALSGAGAPLAAPSRGQSLRERFAQARERTAARRLDHPLARFVLFPLLPALVAFRLHQVIAFGGTFGEWQTYGFVAWATGLAIWWASWSLGLMLVAAVLRVVIETGSLAALLSAPARSDAVRAALETGGRIAFYIGVPAWLAWRVLGND